MSAERGTAVINGRTVEFQAGDTILQAAARAGVKIPTLCHSEGLSPEGGCRMCLVEVDGARQLQAACHMPIRDGMAVRTATARLETLRRELLDLTLSDQPRGALRPDPRGGRFERLLAHYGVNESSLLFDDNESAPRDESHPYLRFDRDACVNCRICLRACEEIQGQFVYGVEGRSAATRLIFGPTEQFADSACVACGACVDRCPTGAVHDRDRTQTPSSSVQTTDSICGYCGVGCRVRVTADQDRVLKIEGVPEASVNRGHLCVKGRYAHAHHHSPDRLTAPLLRDGAQWRKIGWDEANAWLAKRLAEIHAKHGPDALGALTSSRAPNEAAYLLQKLFRTRFGTNNVDCCARVCHSSTALALQTMTGTGAATTSYADIEAARFIVVAGANPTEAHPVVGARLKQAVLRGAPLIVIDPRRVELAECAALHLQLRPGTNVALFNALAKILVEENLFDANYVRDRCEGFDEFAAFLRGLSLEDAASHTGVDAGLIREAARRIGRARPALFVHGLGLSELTQGTASVMTLCNLGLLTGGLGRRGAGMMPLRGQNNVQGNADMGGMPNQFPGYQRLDDPAARARLQTLWGKLPPAAPGRTIPEMLDAAREGKIKALWIQGEDVAQSDPNETRVVEALQNLELLIVQELFFSETARHAHLVLPAAGALEQEGTFTNAERRIQLVRPAVAPPGEARPDWRIIRDAAAALGETWPYSGPADVMDEIARAAPHLFGGVSYARLQGDGLQWPCPTPAHPGTAMVHADSFVRGRARFVAVDYAPTPERRDGQYPYLMITGRVLDHYNVGTMTRRTPSRELVAGDALEIHPDDAARENIADGARVAVRSRWGATEVSARLSRRVAPGTVFLTFHFPESHANRLTSSYVDPQSKCPEYKVTAVNVRPV